MAKAIKKRRKTPTITKDGKVAPSGKRVTAKGTQSNPKPAVLTQTSYEKPSSRLVPILMYTFFGLGVLVILLGYMPGDILPSAIDRNHYILGGLGAICVGFVFSTRYR